MGVVPSRRGSERSFPRHLEDSLRLASFLSGLHFEGAQYHNCSTIYLSWDAASWHISQDLATHVKQRNDEAEAEGYPVVKTAPLPAGAQFLNVLESVSAAWLGEFYTIAITIPLKPQSTRSTAITLNETNTFRHTLREQSTRFGDKSGTKVNFTRVIIAKIPFIVGERASSPPAVSVVLSCLHFHSEM
jgi:hypothetical protein